MKGYQAFGRADRRRAYSPNVLASDSRAIWELSSDDGLRPITKRCQSSNDMMNDIIWTFCTSIVDSIARCLLLNIGIEIMQLQV